MKTTSKIGILISAQIILIITSFLIIVHFESEMILTGNMVNVAGKNRLLTSLVQNEVNHRLFHNSEQAYYPGILEELEKNIVFLKNGGKHSDIEIHPLPLRFEEDWNMIWDKFTQYKAKIDELPVNRNSNLNSDINLENIEQSAKELIDLSDTLTKKLGQDVGNLSSHLVTLQTALGTINVIAHLFMIYLIWSIFKKDAEQKLKIAKFVTIGELASTIAHDIKNPLTAITNSMQIINRNHLKTKDDNITTHEIQRITKSIKRVEHQIDKVLNFVKTVPMQIKDNSIRKIFNTTLETIEIPENIKVKLPKNDFTIECDEEQLIVVFTNILLNAIYAINSSSKKGTIFIGLSDRQNRDYVTIEFENSGPEISEDILSRIFEPLFTTKMQGTGLGLTSCKKIIEQHNGTITINPNPVTFTIKIPKKQK